LDFLFNKGLYGYNGLNLNDNHNAVISYIRQLPEKDLKRIVSDTIWDKYSSYKNYMLGINYKTYDQIYFDRERSQEYYGPIIAKVFTNIIFMDKKLAMVIAKNSRGFILNIVMKVGYGEPAKIAAQRAMKSKDIRVRSKAAKIGPFRIADKLRFDSNASVRRVAIRRIGINHCYRDHLDDPALDIRAAALMAAPLSDFDYLKALDESGKVIRENNAIPRNFWIHKNIVSNILSKMDPEGVLFYLEMSNKDDKIKEVLKYKIGA